MGTASINCTHKGIGNDWTKKKTPNFQRR